MEIQWTDPPLKRITLISGCKWEYHLPLYHAPEITLTWHSDILPQGAFHAAKEDSLSVEVEIPADMPPCFGEIYYKAEDGGQELKGSIIVRIQSSASLPTHTKILSGKNITREQPVKKNQTSKRGRSILREQKETLRSKKVPGKISEEKAAGSNAKEALAQGSSYCIEVLKNNLPVSGLRCRVEKDKTITIGKYSATYGIPDLNLLGHFDSPKLEKGCSRRHAEVFWANQKIYIRILGQCGMRHLTETGEPGKSLKGEYCWPPGEVLIIPGKLRIVLKKEEISS